MVMPPFPPNPYLENPGYMLPHLQPVHYRRSHHSQFPATSAVYRNHGLRQQRNVSVARETVSSEVQTEPPLTETGYADGSPLTGSESGHGTHSSTPSSSGSCSGTQSVTVEDYMAGNDADRNHLVGKMGSNEGTVKHGSGTLSTKPKAMKSQARTLLAAQNGKSGIGQETVVCRRESDTNTDMWSMCSSGNIIPVCNSSDKEDDVTKERRRSFPDILMSWVSGTPPVIIPECLDKRLPMTKGSLPAEQVALAKKIDCNNLETNGKTFEDDSVFSQIQSEVVGKILKLPFFHEMQSMSNTENDPAVLVDSIVAHIHSRNGMSQNSPIDAPSQFQKVPDDELVYDEDSALLEATMQENVLSHFQFRRKINESIWSVESLPPYIPPQDWLMQPELLDPEAIIEEILEDAQKSGPSMQNCNPTSHTSKRLSRRFSLSAEALQICTLPSICLDDQYVSHSNKCSLTAQQDVATSTPTETFQPQMCQMGVQTPCSKREKRRYDNAMDPSNTLASSIYKVVNIGAIAQDVGEEVYMDGPSESEAVHSPNKESCKVTKQRVISPSSFKQVVIPYANSLTEKKSPSSSPNSRQVREGEQNGKVSLSLTTSEQMAVTIQKPGFVSPSRVDCGIQCGLKCSCCCNCHNKDGTLQATLQTSGNSSIHYEFMPKEFLFFITLSCISQTCVEATRLFMVGRTVSMHIKLPRSVGL